MHSIWRCVWACLPIRCWYQLLHKEGGASLYQAYRRAVRRLTDVHLNANVQCLPTDNHCGVLASNTDSTGMCMLCRHAHTLCLTLEEQGIQQAGRPA